MMRCSDELWHLDTNYCGPTMVVSHCVQTSDIVRELCAGVVSPEHSTIDVLGP